MSERQAGEGRRGVIAAATLAGLLAVGGVTVAAAGASAGPSEPPRTVPSPAVALPESAPPSPRAPQPGATDLEVSAMPFAEPVGLEVPAIGISSSTLVPLALEANGELEVPTDFDLPGWYVDGPAPGEFGPAVIAGHVDSTDGPAVFFRLGELQPGATVSVIRSDGSTARFEVDRVERYAKDEFPTAEVYGDTTQRSELRLITCGGDFDRSTPALRRQHRRLRPPHLITHV
jgi:hypothetical protein